MVTVATYEWPILAELARSRLDSSGIDATIAECCFGSIYWQYAKALGGLRLQVADEDADDARAILDEPELPIAEPVVTEIEAQAERFARATIFGLVAFPVTFYALWLGLRLLAAPESLTARARRFAVEGAVLLALTTLLPPALLAVFVFP